MIMKIGPPGRGWTIALLGRLTSVAVPSWNWPTAKFLRMGTAFALPCLELIALEVR